MKWDQVRLKKLSGGVERRVVTTRNIMVVHYVYPPHSVFPAHWHPQEQVTIVEKGEIKYEVDHKRYTLKAGDILVIPSNAHHSAAVGRKKAVTLNIFHPIREDLLSFAKKKMELEQSLHESEDD